MSKNQTKLYISAEGKSKTGRRTAAENKYREIYIQAATKNKIPIVEEDVEKYMYSQISQQSTHKIEEADHEVIRHHIWDLGLKGSSRRNQANKDKIDKLLEDLFPSTEPSDIQLAGVTAAVMNSVNNSRGIQRAVWGMCDGDDREYVASRIASLLFRFCAREQDEMDDGEMSANDLLQRYGITFNPPASAVWNKVDGTIKL